ncbi:MAG: AraC family transcriptional regulator [Lachnospiraceae bacterium]|nr:AraC family transcriptional regulator [Lachnospiraceae bacterium]
MGEYKEVLNKITEVVDSHDYERVYYESGTLAEKVLDFSDRHEYQAERVLAFIKGDLGQYYSDHLPEETKIMQCFQDEDLVLVDKLSAENAFYQLLDCLVRNLFIYKYPVVEPAFHYIDERMDNYINMEGVAEICGVSHQYLLRLFRKMLNVSLSNYIHLRKMMKAKEYLYFEKLTNKEVASRLGYEDCAYFAKVFKKYEHMTPSQYRMLDKKKRDAMAE